MCSYMDKVRSVSENGAVTASFTYDVDGQIATAKTHATGKQESFLWDGLARKTKFCSTTCWARRWECTLKSTNPLRAMRLE